MEKPLIGQRIIFLESVDSTNNYSIKAFKAGEIDSGTVIIADFQTKGKGQRENSWQAEPASNLLVSIAVDLNLWKIKNIISLNHIVALSIQSFLSQYANGVFIKWPNDIMVSNKKIAGILIETQLSSSIKKAIIGFGVNINQDLFEAPRATSLLLETQKKYNHKDFVPEIIKIFNSFIKEYQEKGEEYLHHLFNQELWKINQDHLFEVNGISKKGQIISTTMDGRLIVEHANKEQYYSNGEVKY